MFQKALREYEAVSAETSLADGSTHAADGSSTRAPASIDVRRFPWIRPLAGDYAFNFARVAALYAGDPASRQAWAETIDRVRSAKRAHQAVADVIAAQQARRNAPT